MIARRHKNIKVRIQIILFVLAIVVALFFLTKVFNNPDIVTQISELRDKNAAGFDSLDKRMYQEKKLFDSLEYLISSGKLQSAEIIINQLLKKDRLDESLHILKGEIFDARMQYDSALNEYNFAIYRDPYSNGLDKRAITFIKLGRYQEAISDYRTAYEFNFDYSNQLAQIFELLKQKDSALKYYKIYLQHYPDSGLQKKVQSLQK